MKSNSDTPKKKKKKTRYQKAKTRRKIVNSIMGFVIFCGLLGCLSGFSLIYVMINKSDVVLNPSDLNSQESSIIYDCYGNEVSMVGKESRINVTYHDLPQSVIDAFVSVEDSRFFEHPGFDVPRFAKAFLENIKSLSFSQGGSTITMQVIKNTYFAVDTIAEKSIPRKVQEIYFSLKVSQIVSKEKILEMYINKVNYGSTARGIQVAADYYFGKTCQELNLVESAMLAGIVNSPNLNNPYYYLDNCNERTHEVLYLMYYHGYITEQEYNVAKKVDIADLLVGTSSAGYNDGETVPNRAYLDIVLEELETTYEIDPYTTAVRVYTGLNQDVQKYFDDVANGKILKFKDEYINTAMVALENKTGLIVGVCGGRNYNGERIFNYAYDARKQIGSTAKAILTYPLAFEYLGMATSYYIVDEPITWTNSKVRVSNDTSKYYGQVSVQKAFSQSFNIPSIKLYKLLREAIGDKKIGSYLESIGLDHKVAVNANEQYAIGGSYLQASPIQMAAAESVILSGGTYTTPHTITRIEFINSTKEPIIANYSAKRVLSEGASWLAKYLQNVAVNGGGSASDVGLTKRLKGIAHSKYTVYGKTGTTSVNAALKKKYPSIPSNAGQEIWMVAGTNDYSVSCWLGYDTGKYASAKTYLTNTERHACWDSKLVNGILDNLYSTFGKPKSDPKRPSTVTEITSLRANSLNPITAPSWAPAGNTIKGYILKDYATYIDYIVPPLANLNSASATSVSNSTITINWQPYPDEAMLTAAQKTLTLTYGKSKWTGARAYDDTWICGTVVYEADVYDAAGKIIQHVSSTSASKTIAVPVSVSDQVYSINCYYTYQYAPDISNIYPIKVTVKGTGLLPPEAQ